MTAFEGGPLRSCSVEVVEGEVIVTDRRISLRKALALLALAHVVGVVVTLPALEEGARGVGLIVVSVVYLSVLAFFGALYMRREYRQKAPRRIPIDGPLKTEVVDAEVRNARSLASSRTLYARVGGKTYVVTQVAGSSPDYERLPEIGRWLEAIAASRTSAPRDADTAGFEGLRRELGLAPRA